MLVSGSQDNIAKDNEASPLFNWNSVAVIADDCAAWGKLRCEARVKVKSGDNETVLTVPAVYPETGQPYIVVPKDDNGNKIADAGGLYDAGDPGDDDDAHTGVAAGAVDYPGDALTRFEEYRGFMVIDEKTGNQAHRRTDPNARDYFCYNADPSVLDLSMFQSASHLVVHLVTEEGRDASTLAVNFAWDEAADSGLGIQTKRQVAPTLMVDNTLGNSVLGQYWVADMRARINVARIEYLHGGSDFAYFLSSVVAHELGHSCWLSHHGGSGGESDDMAAAKGCECIMRYNRSSEESSFCTTGANAETQDPTPYGFSSWDCEPGRGDCLHRIRVNPVRNSQEN